MNSKTIIFIIAAVLVITGTGFFLLQKNQSPEPQNKIGASDSDTASGIFELKLENYSGEAVSLANFRGKSLVINSWAAWCPFCRKELADFVAVQKEFGDKVIIIAIDRVEPKETAKKYTDELGIAGDLIFLLDPTDAFYQSIGGFSMPETVFVNSNGDIVFHKRGPMDVKEMRERIQELLN